MASVLVDKNSWQKAADCLLQALLIGTAPRDDVDHVRLLGQCIMRADDRLVRGLGDYLVTAVDGSGRQLAAKLAALVLKDDSASMAAALACDLTTLRSTSLGARIFIPEKPKPQIQAAPPSPPTRGRSGSRQGKVSAFYTDRGFGFLVDDTTGSTWYFHASVVIDDDELLSSLQQGVVRQYVIFEGSSEVLSGRYPAAKLVRSTALNDESVVERPYRAPLPLRLAAVPKDKTPYSRAKRAEQLDRLDEAESLFREEIARKGIHFKSAIKDLSTLLNRRGQPELAIQLLEEHRTSFSSDELTSLEQLTTNFLLKARRFDDAAARLSRLARQETRPMQRLALLRQEAYCLFAAGQLDEALRKLDALVQTHPRDNATLLLAEKVRQAKAAGILPSEATRFAEEIAEGDETLASLAMALSSLARRHLDTCDLRGLDARTKESRDFSSQDFQQLERMLDGLKGRRPRERADYLLTLAALCELSPEAAGNRSLHQLLRRHFSALEEAFLVEGAHVDVVRCFAVESLALSPVKVVDERDAHQIEAAWVLLLGTYCSSNIEPSSLLKPEQGQRVPTILKALAKRPDDWRRFTQDARYYRLRAASAFVQLEPAIRSTGGLTAISNDVDPERARLREDDDAFATLALDAVSADRLRKAREALAQRVPHARFDLDRARLTDCVKLLGDAADYALERHFRERETRYLRLETDSDRLLQEIERFPTHLSIERLAPALRSMRELWKLDFARTETAKPSLELRNVLDSDFYVVSDGAVALRLLLTSHDESTAPVEAIDLLATRGELCHSPEPLHGGQSREFELFVRPTEAQVRDGAFTVDVTVQYRTRSGAMDHSAPQPLAVRLGSGAFTEIPNAYSRYSGGSPVEDERMFFGRTDLVERIRTHLCKGEPGQCFVLYGQKRSGKSSVLKRVEQRLSPDVVFAALSAGTLSPSNLWGSFARLLVQEIAYCLEDRSLVKPDHWPSSQEVDARPIELVRDLMRFLRKSGYRVVIAVDEFTYVYEAAPSDAEAFMRGWKALLEAKAFSALLVGQDTMPRFKQAFPNEFGVTHDERISYLSEEEAARMASEPISLDGASRYRGQALSKLIGLTAGSPFFLQIACDRLVRHLNARRASFITEADIDQVAGSLSHGADALPPEKFDALVTAAGERVATIPKETLWQIVARVASESLHSGWCYRTALAELPRNKEAIKDLVDREILATEGERVRLRVGLFSTWLRANQ
jgi:hypothetical protein